MVSTSFAVSLANSKRMRTDLGLTKSSSAAMRTGVFLVNTMPPAPSDAELSSAKDGAASSAPAIKAPIVLCMETSPLARGG